MRPAVIGRLLPMLSSDWLLPSLAPPGKRLDTEEREWAGEAGGVALLSFTLSTGAWPVIGQ